MNSPYLDTDMSVTMPPAAPRSRRFSSKVLLSYSRSSSEHVVNIRPDLSSTANGDPSSDSCMRLMDRVGFNNRIGTFSTLRRVSD